jgi:hypothetical protein
MPGMQLAVLPPCRSGGPITGHVGHNRLNVDRYDGPVERAFYDRPMARYSQYGRGAKIKLYGASTPAPPHIRPRHRDAEVHWDDGSWRPVTIRAWHHLGEPARDMMSGRLVIWLVWLEGPGADLDLGDGWYAYWAADIRPA